VVYSEIIDEELILANLDSAYKKDKDNKTVVDLVLEKAEGHQLSEDLMLCLICQ
jgi:hypothetical protein